MSPRRVRGRWGLPPAPPTDASQCHGPEPRAWPADRWGRGRGWSRSTWVGRGNARSVFLSWTTLHTPAPAPKTYESRLKRSGQSSRPTKRVSLRRSWVLQGGHSRSDHHRNGPTSLTSKKQIDYNHPGYGHLYVVWGTTRDTRSPTSKDIKNVYIVLCDDLFCVRTIYIWLKYEVGGGGVLWGPNLCSLLGDGVFWFSMGFRSFSRS